MMRFTQDGMDVKSMLVPLVDACAVPLTIGYNAPVVPVTSPELVIAPLLMVPAVMFPTDPVNADVPVTLRFPVSVTPGAVMPVVPSSVIAMSPSYSY